MKKKKIVITNAYTWYNKGDSGILLATVDSLKKIYGKAIEINILSFSPEEDGKRYLKDKVIKGVYSNILNPHPYKSGKVGKSIAIIKLFLKMIFLQVKLILNKEKTIMNNEALKVLDDSDVIVVCGGGFLGGKKYDSLMHIYQMYADSIFKKPIFVMGISIEPIKSKILKHYTDKVLKNMEFIFAREKITEKYLSEILKKDKYALIPDMAFMLPFEIKKYKFLDKLKKENKRIFGITVRNWNFPNLENKNLAQKNYITSIREMMINYIKNQNAVFIFVPQVTTSTCDDTIIAKRIKEGLPDELKSNFVIRTDDWSPIEIKALIGNMDYFIGTRMHSNIFATSAYVPTTAIAYEKKTNGIMLTLELQNYIVEIDTINSKELIKKIDLMIKNENEIRKNLKINIPIIQKEIINVLSGHMKGVD